MQDEGRTVPLRIGIFMSDVDAPDLQIFTTPALAARIRELMRAFADEQGL